MELARLESFSFPCIRFRRLLGLRVTGISSQFSGACCEVKSWIRGVRCAVGVPGAPFPINQCVLPFPQHLNTNKSIEQR